MFQLKIMNPVRIAAAAVFTALLLSCSFVPSSAESSQSSSEPLAVFAVFDSGMTNGALACGSNICGTYRASSPVLSGVLRIYSAVLSNSVELTISGSTEGAFRAVIPPLPSGTYYIKAEMILSGSDILESPTVMAVLGGSSDVTPPVLRLSAPISNKVYGQTIPVSGTAIDSGSGVSAVMVSLSGGAYFEAGISHSNFSLSAGAPSNGTYTVSVYAVDNSGNTSPTNTVPVVVDDALPGITITGPSNGTVVRFDPVTVAGTVSAPEGHNVIKVLLSVNNGAFVTEAALYGGTWSAAVNIPAEGQVSVTARAVTDHDRTNDSQALFIVLDSLAPVCSIALPSADAVITSSAVNIEGTVSDEGTGLDAVYLSVDSGDFILVSYSTAFSAVRTLSNGSHTVSVFAVDRAGNTGATNSRAFTVEAEVLNGIRIHYKKPADWNAPKLYYYSTSPIVSHPAWGSSPLMQNEIREWYVHTISNTAYALVIFQDGTRQNPGGGQAGFPVSNEMWYDGKAWYSYSVIDYEPPTVQVTSPAQGVQVTGVISLSADALDNKGMERVDFFLDTKKIGSDTEAPYTLQWDSAYSPPGQHTLTAVAVDRSGNAATNSRTFSTSNANVPPYALCGGDKYGPVSNTISFSAVSSYDPNGTISTYYWTDMAGWTAWGVTASRIYYQPGTNTVYLIVTDNDGASATNSFSVITYYTSRGDFREETIYFVIPTRFYDGDPANNVHCWDEGGTIGFEESDPSWRGDFEGLIQKLDYIKALGFSAIWITPVVQNASGVDYHGYHAINFSRVDSRYKTTGDATPEESYRRLIQAAHAKGLKIIQDIVVNHTGNFGEENIRPLFIRNAPVKDANDRENFSLALTRTNAPGVLPDNYESLPGGDQFQARIRALRNPLDSENIYHHTEFKGGWEQYEVQVGSIDGDCQDLNTENPAVQQYLVDVYNRYIDMGVDAFRVDTVKHVSRLTFNNVFIPAWKERGGSNFFIFGETCVRIQDIWNKGIPAISTPFYTWKESSSYPWGSRTVNEASVAQHYIDNESVHNEPQSGNHWLSSDNVYRQPDWSMRSGFDQIDFPMHWAFRSAGEAWNRAVGGDRYYSDATWNVTYVDSHDYAPDGAPEYQRYNADDYTWAENLSLIFTFRGIPCLYYGSEIQFKKGCDIDPAKNKKKLSESGRAYYGDHLTGSVNAQDYGIYTASGQVSTTLNHPLAQHIRRLNMIRRAVPALQKGRYSTADMSGSFAFKRRYTDAAKGIDSFVLVCISGGATFNNIPNGTYRDAVTGTVYNVSTGSLSVSCSGKGNARILVLNGPGKIGDTGTYLK